MKKGQDNELTNYFSNQIKIINTIYDNLNCDLYVCFETEEEVNILQKKIIKLQKMKKNLIRIYASLIAEY
jgi:hypothetical protein